MNKKAKGRRHEKVIAELFRQAGWTVHLVQPAIAFDPKTGRYYARPQDVFGADLIAMKKSHMVVFVQVTSDTSIGRKIELFRKYNFPWSIVKVFIFQAKKKAGRWKYRVIEVCEKEEKELNQDMIELYFDFGWDAVMKLFQGG